MALDRKPFADMSLDEVQAWIQQTRERLRQKMRRERAYLDRRAVQARHTPTDEVFEADQLLEADLLRLLDELEQGL